MSSLTRRTFLKTAAMATTGMAFTARSWSQVAGANGDIRLAIAGLNGRGRELAANFRALKGVRVVALCDVDIAVLSREMAAARAAGTNPDAVVDYRDLLPRRDVDAIAIATPNHLHALQAVWAMQAGKDVLLEKPVSHNLWEGPQIIAAAKQHGRIVQVFTQNRSSTAIAEAIAWMNAGHLGKVTLVRGIVYKRRLSIGKLAAPVQPPATVNYDMFQGPAPLVPLRRTNFHYDWHWQWETGNGDMVAQGNHQLDVGRRLLGDPDHPARVFTIGGRVGYEDDGETPNTFLVHYDYPTPFIFEVRGLPAKPDDLSGNAAGKGGLGSAGQLAASMDKFLGLNVGNVAHCEGGYLAIPAANYSLAQAFDRDGKLVKEFRGFGNHHTNFLDAMRSRKESDLAAPLLQGHRSSALVHLANISHRIGRQLRAGEIAEQVKGRSQLAEPFARCTAHLAANQIDLAKTPLVLGAPLTFDAATEKFTGENSVTANPLRTREYRSPWIVPQLA
ncbi:MAG: Gfo/Idh/MocA family oxidoreductase [Opitutaceae bacterium]